MANLNIEYSTGYSVVSESNSNVPYRLKVYYMITKRTENSITFNIDVEVNYPTYWSSNGGWVKYKSYSKACNPNQTTGVKTFFASTQSSYRASNSWWLTGLTISSLNPTDTNTRISIGFSNLGWGETSYSYYNFDLAIPIGYTSIGVAGTPVIENEWLTDISKINWTPAANGINNNVTKYVLIINKELQGQQTEISIENGLNLNYTYNTTELAEGTKIKCKIRTYDSYNQYTDSGYSKISTKNFKPTPPSITFLKDEIEQLEEKVDVRSVIKVGGSTDNGGIFTEDKKLAYSTEIKGLGFASGDPYIEDNYVFLSSDILLFNVGKDMSFECKSFDGLSYSNPSYKTIKVGKIMNFEYESPSQINLETSILIKNISVDNFKCSYNTIFYLSASYDNKNFTLIETKKSYSTKLTFSNVLEKILKNIGVKPLEQNFNIPVFIKIEGRIGDYLQKEINFSCSYNNIIHSIEMNEIDGVNVTEEYHTKYYSSIPYIKENFSIFIKSLQAIEYPCTIIAKLFVKTYEVEEPFSFIQDNEITFSTENEVKKITYLLNSLTTIDKKLEAKIQLFYKKNNLETILSENKLKWNNPLIPEPYNFIIERNSITPFTLSSSTKEHQFLSENEETNGFEWNLSLNWNILNGTGCFILKNFYSSLTGFEDLNNQILILDKNITTYNNLIIGETTDYDNPIPKVINFNIEGKNFPTNVTLLNNQRTRFSFYYNYYEGFLKRNQANPEGELDLNYKPQDYVSTNTLNIYYNTFSNPTPVSNISFEKIPY